VNVVSFGPSVQLTGQETERGMSTNEQCSGNLGVRTKPHVHHDDDDHDTEEDLGREEPAAKRSKPSAALSSSPRRGYVIQLLPDPSNFLLRRGDRVSLPRSRKRPACFGTFVEVAAGETKDATEASRTAWVTTTTPGTTEEEARERIALSRLFPVIPPSTTPLLILVTKETAEFRSAAAGQIDEEADVLEVGCSTGETAEILWRRCRSWVGLDTSRLMLERVKERLDDTTGRRPSRTLVAKVDALVDPSRALEVSRRFHPQGPTDIFLDIGGNRSEEAVWRMLLFLCGDATAFPRLRQIVVKSRELSGSLWKQLPTPETTITTHVRHLSQLRLERDDAWLRQTLAAIGASSDLIKLPKHPQRAPLRMSPVDGTTAICRYHNYHPKGCFRFKDGTCPYDHTHCHLCLQPGHLALSCPSLEQE
jgi:SAM-dependent methyltransferase